jgi:DNA-binding response OmpR family regulator
LRDCRVYFHEIPAKNSAENERTWLCPQSAGNSCCETRAKSMSLATNSPGSILLIEDDAGLFTLMKEFFALHHLEVQSANDGRAGLAKALSDAYDLIILDVMLPVIDGFEVLRQIRKRSEVPIIMLTARTTQSDRVTGLEQGADDYLPKPFDPEELLARIRAVLRRSGKSDLCPRVIEIKSIKLDPQSRTVWRSGDPVSLTSIQFDILEILMRAAGRVVSRDEITAILYQRPATPYERSLDVHISQIRKKIEETRGPIIQTIRGQGYLLTPGNGELR